MTSLENRLQDTEAALYAALKTLHERDGHIGLANWPAESISPALSTPQRSKAEKQHEWKRQQLQTGEDLVAWFAEKQQRIAIAHENITAPFEHPPSDQLHSVEPSTIYTTPGPRALDFSAHAHPSSTPPVDVMEQLKSCKCPTVPNGSSSPTASNTWLKNYF
jgi:hypothetical protein